MKKLCILLALAFLTVSCVESPRSPAMTRGNYNLQAPYLWSDKSFPKQIGISNQFTTAESLNISDAGNAWRTALDNKMNFLSFGGRVDEVTSNITNLDVFLDSTLGVYRITKWPMELPGTALAVTQLFGRRYNTGTASEFVNIEHADILVNMDGFLFNTSDAAVPGRFDLRTVILHEFGHFLGLPHNSSVGRSKSVMYPSITTSEIKRTPLSADISALAEKYNISLGGVNSQTASTQRPVYRISEGDEGEETKILVELHADGSCVHKENGAVIRRHQSGL